MKYGYNGFIVSCDHEFELLILINEVAKLNLVHIHIIMHDEQCTCMEPAAEYKILLSTKYK